MSARAEILDPSTRGSLVGADRLTIYTEAAAVFHEMLRAIAVAQKSVRLESYIFRPDHVGEQFSDALIAAATRGVEVRVLVDWFGTCTVPAAFFQRMRDGGVRVLHFNPMSPVRPRYPWRLRDHRKLLTVDDRVAFTGSLNIGSEIGGSEPACNWLETHVKIEGPTASELEALFDENWECTEKDHKWFLPPSESCELPVDVSPTDTWVSASQVRVLKCGTWKDRHQIGKVIRALMHRARHRITIMNPYFVPGRRLLREIHKACRRGVQVRLMLCGNTDVPPVWYASRALYARLLRWGAEIWLWQGTHLHSKIVVVDDAWSTIGSFNLDNFSAIRNLEVAIAVSNRSVAGTLEWMFEGEKIRAVRLTAEEWARRPFLPRILERLAYFFKYWL